MPAKVETDYEVLIDCLERGMDSREIGEVFGCSNVTIENRIAQIQKSQGVLMRYRAIQSLQLTSLQASVLEAITPEKIAEAPLKDLVVAYKILKDHELTIEGKPNEIKGLVSYLIQLEKEEANLVQAPSPNPGDSTTGPVIDIPSITLPTLSRSAPVTDEDYIPNL